MTEPDPIADLAAQLAMLRRQWARSQGEIGALREQLKSSTGQQMLLLVQVKRLAKQLNDALAKKEPTSPPAPWWCVSEAEIRSMLAELRHWIEDFARKQYPAYIARLRPCWPNHPEAVWELSTLMAEWERVYGDEDNRDLAGALWWHERWLPGVIARLEKAITCDEAGCRRLTRRSP